MMKPTTPPAWLLLVAEADLCADHARNAADCGRFCAACGLLMTAGALCNRALEAGSERCEAEVARRLGFYQDEVDRLLEAAMTRRLETSGGGLDAR